MDQAKRLDVEFRDTNHLHALALQTSGTVKDNKSRLQNHSAAVVVRIWFGF